MQREGCYYSGTHNYHATLIALDIKYLCRVRDEIRMTIAAYQTLYESSVAFGMRKSLMSEQGKADLEQANVAMDQEKQALEQQAREINLL